MNDGPIKVAELFAGIGGFRLGLEQASPRFKTVWANEIDKHASQIYRTHWNDGSLHEGDIREIQTSDIPDIDLLAGGFPCQPFSMAGKREGFADTRGTLFHEILRVAKAKQPKMLFLENVKGLLSHDNGDTFETILRALGNAGYWWEYKVLNSKFFGVPQNRERVFIIGHSRNHSTRQVFNITSTDQPTYETDSGKSPPTQLAHALTATDAKQHGDGNYVVQLKRTRADGNHMIRTYEDEVPTLTSQMGTGGGNVPMIVADRTRSYAGLGRNIESPKPIANTLSGVQKDNLVLLDNLGGNIKERIKPLDGNTAWTLGGSKTGIQHEQTLRRLTPTECERLQGFLDGWTEGISDTQRYKCLGNAVTVNVIEAIGELILEALD